MLYLALVSMAALAGHRLHCHSFLSNYLFKRLSFTWPLSVFDFLYKTSILTCIFLQAFNSMGRSDDNIFFSKTQPTMHVPAAQLGSPTLLAGRLHRQNISPLLESNQSRRDTASHFRDNVPPGPPPPYYAQSQSRDVLIRSGAVGGSSAYRLAEVGSTAHLPGGISNRDFRVENSMQLLQDTSFQFPTYATAQSYEGHAIHLSRLQHVTPLSGGGVSARSFANDRYMLGAGPPAQILGGIPDRNYMLANPVPLQPDTVLRSSSDTTSYGSRAITPRYEDDVRHVSESHTAELSRPTGFYDPFYLPSDHSLYGIAPPHPSSSSSSSIPVSRTETSHSSAHQPIAFTDHTVQVASLREHGVQQSASPRVLCVDGCFIDEDDLGDQGINNGSIFVGECLRSDSPCGLWVKADKGSIKRHAQKWHRVARGGDTNTVLCTWDGCRTEMQKSAVPRHTLCKHFGQTFQCNGCLKFFTRDDCWRPHAVKCTRSCYGYSVTYSPRVRAINGEGMSLRQVGY